MPDNARCCVLLDGRALRWIYNTVVGKSPLQLNFPFALWTAAMVQTLIFERYRVRLSRSSVSRLLHQLGLSAQRPLWRAYQQNPEAVRRWVAEAYPSIQRRAKREGAQIFFADEAGVRSDFHSGSTWGRRGRTPIVSSTGARFGVNLMSAVSARGELRFMVTKGRVTAAVFIAFLKRLLVNAPGPVFVIADGHSTHRAKMVERFVATLQGKLALFILPPYSPELNPDEYVWNDLKTHGIGRRFITSLAQMRQMVLSHLRRLLIPAQPARARPQSNRVILGFICLPPRHLSAHLHTGIVGTGMSPRRRSPAAPSGSDSPCPGAKLAIASLRLGIGLGRQKRCGD